MIYRNQNPSGKSGNMVFGLAAIADGLIRVLSIGLLHTNLPVTVSRIQVQRHIKRLERQRAHEHKV